MFTKLKSLLFNDKFSHETAKNRLQMVLVQDRSGLSSQDMDFFKKDLIEVIQKYFVLERNSLDVEWQREQGCTALVINTPVMSRPKSPKQAVAN